ncbi:plasmid stabilization system protein ParE [Rhizobium pisi]
MILEFSDEAENDLEQIADYIAWDNPRRARRHELWRNPVRRII